MAKDTKDSKDSKDIEEPQKKEAKEETKTEPEGAKPPEHAAEAKAKTAKAEAEP